MKGGLFISMEVCISCGKELAIMERNRCECWDCREKTNETYGEDSIEE
jgi:hypothetical protein